MPKREIDSAPASLDRELYSDPAIRAFLGVLRTASKIVQDTEDELRSAGYAMSTKEWDVLAAVVAFGPARPAEILRRTSMTRRPQTLSSVLDRLQARGYVERTPHPEDPRGVLVSLTRDGAKMADQVFPYLARQVIQPFVSRFTRAEILALGEILGGPTDEPPSSGP